MKECLYQLKLLYVVREQADEPQLMALRGKCSSKMKQLGALRIGQKCNIILISQSPGVTQRWVPIFNHWSHSKSIITKALIHISTAQVIHSKRIITATQSSLKLS